MQRKTVSMPRMVFELINKLDNGQREIAYDTIFRALFNDKDITYNDLPERVSDVLIVAKYELKKVKTKFDNGCVKKLKNDTPIFASKSYGSEMKRNEANLSEPATSYFNNKLNNNIYNIYTNKQTKENTIKENKATIDRNTQPPQKQDDNGEQKNSQTKTQDPCDFELTSENLNKAQFYYSILQDKSECIADNFVKSRFLELAQRLCQEQTPLKIKGVYTSPDEILNKFVNLFRCEPKTSNKQLIEVFEYFDEKVETGTIKNTYKYLISIFYNVAREGSFSTVPQIQQKQPYTSFANQEIMQHNYTQEQINSIFNTNLDEIEI